MHDRRSFLRGLTTLPLIGGSVALIGQPTAVAQPITDDLLWSYKAWLQYEHRMLSYEIAGHDERRLDEVERFIKLGYPGDRFHFQWRDPQFKGMAGWDNAPQPSTRAAVVLSAVGCPLTGGRSDG